MLLEISVITRKAESGVSNKFFRSPTQSRYVTTQYPATMLFSDHATTDVRTYNYARTNVSMTLGSTVTIYVPTWSGWFERR